MSICLRSLFRTRIYNVYSLNTLINLDYKALINSLMFFNVLVRKLLYISVW